MYLDYAARRLRGGFSIRKRYWSDFYISYITRDEERGKQINI